MRCACCDRELGELAFDTAFGMPDELWELEEGTEGVFMTEDLASYHEKYFIRGIAFIPIRGSDESYGWGVWAQVSKEDFLFYVNNYERDNSSYPRFSGILANTLSVYNEITLGLSLEIQLEDEKNRPTFYFRETKHRLSHDQREGVEMHDVERFSRFYE